MTDEMIEVKKAFWNIGASTNLICNNEVRFGFIILNQASQVQHSLQITPDFWNYQFIISIIHRTVKAGFGGVKKLVGDIKNCFRIDFLQFIALIGE